MDFRFCSWVSLDFKIQLFGVMAWIGKYPNQVLEIGSTIVLLGIILPMVIYIIGRFWWISLIFDKSKWFLSNLVCIVL